MAQQAARHWPVIGDNEPLYDDPDLEQHTPKNKPETGARNENLATLLSPFSAMAQIHVAWPSKVVIQDWNKMDGQPFMLGISSKLERFAVPLLK